MPKFKVGNKVRVTNPQSSYHTLWGIVDSYEFFNISGNTEYYVHLDGIQETLRFSEDELETALKQITIDPTVEQLPDTGSAATSKHYNAQVIQPIEVMQSVLTHEEFLGFLKGNILKYSARAGTKNGESSEKDLNKAKQYSLWKRLAEEGKTIDPRKDVV